MKKPGKSRTSRPDLTELACVMAKLRAPDGCPWDREQTLDTLVPFIIEEAYEVVGAIESGSPESLKEELGDLLFQVIFASQLASELGDFRINDVIKSCVEKMVRRHPHVFGQAEAATTKEVLKHWAHIKKEEKIAAGQEESALSGVPEAFPALLRAHKISEKAAKTGFDWKSVDQVLDKVTEELDEFREALLSNDTKATEEELGDILFALVNLGRFVEVNPEDALRKTIGRFINRFHHIEKTIEDRGKELNSTPIDEMERLWDEAKKMEKRTNSDG